jgi:hypothetical protein
MTHRQRWIAVALMGILFAQLVTTVPRLSLTADEPVYMGAGYAFLRSGDLRLATAAQHPPLMQELVALPLLLQPGPELEALEGWDTAEMARFAPAFVTWYGDALDEATFAARLPVIGLALLWSAFLFRWATDWFGAWGGLAALTLFVFDPNILAHGALATNDTGFAAASFIALFGAMRFLRRPMGRYLALTGLALGAGLSSKSSGFFLALALVALFLLDPLLNRNRRTDGFLRRSLQLSLILLIGVMILWASYGFEVGPLAGKGISVPLATQWKVWAEMREHLSQGHTGYLMGQIRDTGWLGYYPIAFALKTPLFTLVLLGVGLLAALASGPKRWLSTLPLWIFPGGYVAATLMSNVATGYRFLLPLLPFAFILIAHLFRDGVPWLRTPVARWGSWVGLALLGALVSGLIHPHYLAYFNALAGGPDGGDRYLVDSNLDWGQSFRSLRRYMDEWGIDRVRLSYYTYVDPALYGVRYGPIAPSPGASSVLAARFNPPPGTYAIGATTLHGLMVVDPDMFSWFRHREPVARPGHAILIYRVDEPDAKPAWLAQCTQPVAPLTPEAITEGFGREELRVAYFDCTQAWLLPTGGEAAGWYALRRSQASELDPFVAGHLEPARLNYEQRSDRKTPAFLLYEQPQGAPTTGCSEDAITLDGPLSFLGQTQPETIVHPGDTIEIETCWRVTGLTERPLSIMLHLLGPDAGPPVVGDGLGVAVESWQIGDIFVQRHRLTLPAEAAAGDYTLYTGAYWLDTLERWPVLVDGKPAGDQVPLAPLSVASR